ATSSYTPGDADAGLHVRVTVNFTDASGLRHSATSPTTVNTVENQNDLPTGLSIPAAPVVGQIMIATPVQDGDGLEDVVFTYEWERSPDATFATGVQLLASSTN